MKIKDLRRLGSIVILCSKRQAKVMFSISGTKKAQKPMTSALFPDFLTMLKSILTPTRNIKSMHPKNANVSLT